MKMAKDGLVRKADIFKVDRLVFQAQRDFDKELDKPISKRLKQRSYTVPIFEEPEIISAARRLGAFFDPRNAPFGFVNITTEYKIPGITKYPKKSELWMKLGGPGRYETVEFKWIKKGKKGNFKGNSLVRVRGSTTEYPSAAGGMAVEVFFNETFAFNKPADQVSIEEIIDELEEVDFFELLEEQHPELFEEEYDAKKGKKNQKKNDEPYPSGYNVRQAKKLVKIKKITEEGNFISVRLRDPGQFKIIRTPTWAVKVAESVTKGSKVRMGQTPKGNWLIQTILIPKARGKVKARSMGRKIQKKIEGK